MSQDGRLPERIVNIGTDDTEVNATGWTGDLYGWLRDGYEATAYKDDLSVAFGKNLTSGDKVIGAATGKALVFAHVVARGKANRGGIIGRVRHRFKRIAHERY